MDISFDILNQIFELLDFLSKIRFRQISKYFLNNFYIYDFYNLGKGYLKKITAEILISYPKIKYLDISKKKQDICQNINFLTDLQKLAISRLYKNQISIYNLKKLEIYDYKIKNLKYFTKLEQLFLRESGIADSDLDGLNLRKLAICCDQISNINHMTRLKKLNIFQNYKIRNSNIQNLNLLELSIQTCPGITDFNFLTNIRYLSFNHVDYNLSNINLRELVIYTSNSDFSHMTNLTKLTIYGGCPIINLSKINLSELDIRNNNSDFSHMTNLTNLNMAFYHKPVNLNKLVNLKYLDCSYSNIQDGDILNINPEKLNISNTNITDISHLTNLRELEASTSKITKIQNLNLEKLTMNWNIKIQKIKLPKLKYLEVLYCREIYLEKINCPNLVELRISSKNITNLNNLKNLRKLLIWNCLAIYNTSIQNLELDYIGLRDNQTITNLNYMTSLKILSITGYSGLQNTSIQKLNLLELELQNNKTITDINIFTNLKKLLICGIDTSLEYSGVKNLDKTKIRGYVDNLKNPNI